MSDNMNKNPLRFLPRLVLIIAMLVIVFAGGHALGQGVKTGMISLERFENIPIISDLPIFNHEEEEAALNAITSSRDENGAILQDGEAINILLMGIDARDPNENTRSDTMILLSADPSSKQVGMISIPRDTKIKSKRGIVEKINSVNANEGPEAACEVVEDLLNVSIDNYVIVNFQTFINIIDILGGVDLYVDTYMFHEDTWQPELQIELQEGYQHLDGYHSLMYVRYRGGATADIGRTQRQQKFIKAVAEKLFTLNMVKRIPNLWAEVKNSIRTDLSLTDITMLARVGMTLQDATIYSQTLPGEAAMSGGTSYWIPYESHRDTLVSDVRSGNVIEVTGDSFNNQNPEDIVYYNLDDTYIPEISDDEIVDLQVPDNFWAPDTSVNP